MRFLLLLLACSWAGFYARAAETGAPPREESHPISDFPGGARLFVSNERSGDISVIDLASLEVVATFPVGKRPRGIHVGPVDGHVYVALSGSPRMAPGVERTGDTPPPDRREDAIAVIDPATRRVVRRLKVGTDPEQFDLSADGRVLVVSNEDASAASFWAAASGRAIAQAKVGEEPEGVAFRPGRNEVYITCEERGEVYVLTGDTGERIARFEVVGRPRNVAFTPDGARAFVAAEGNAAVTVVDAERHRVLREIKIEGDTVLPMGTAMAADGRTLFVTTGRGNSVAVIDIASERVAAVIPVGRRPWGVALSPDGRTLFTANGGSDDVSVIDVAARREQRRIKVGAGPWGLAIGVGRKS